MCDDARDEEIIYRRNLCEKCDNPHRVIIKYQTIILIMLPDHSWRAATQHTKFITVDTANSQQRTAYMQCVHLSCSLFRIFISIEILRCIFSLFFQLLFVCFPHTYVMCLITYSMNCLRNYILRRLSKYVQSECTHNYILFTMLRFFFILFSYTKILLRLHSIGILCIGSPIAVYTPCAEDKTQRKSEK